jgi:hypothetical protein
LITKAVQRSPHPDTAESHAVARLPVSAGPSATSREYSRRNMRGNSHGGNPNAKANATGANGDGNDGGGGANGNANGDTRTRTAATATTELSDS